MLKLLATLDGSAVSEAALPVVERMAGVGAHVDLLTVVEPPAATPRSSVVHPVNESLQAVPGATSSVVVERPGDPQWAEDQDQAIQRALAEGRDYLSTFTEPLTKAGFEVDLHAVIADHAGDAIANFARQNSIDMIFMATHGRSGLSELVQGSVAAAVVRSGVAPVTLVSPTRQS